MQLKDILTIDNGAKFLNVDLHIHSFGASDDVTDPQMTAENIVESAVAQGLSVIAITDHNSDANVRAAMSHAAQFAGELLVLPGTEITTAHGHLLVYFDPARVADLAKFLAKIDLIGERGAADTRTAKSMSDVVSEAEALGAICIAAHIDREKTGFERFAPGYQNWKKDVIQNAGLYGIECDDPANLCWYSDTDEGSSAGAERKKIYAGRREKQALKGRHALARLQGSDSHTMAQFETGDPDKVWTRMKLADLTWSSVRTALVDPEARVRAAALVPKVMPRIRGMAVVGGFLDGEVIHFSNNLNSLIGGRGTGKSTTIRALAYAFGHFDKFSEFENCPNVVQVFCEDANGVPYLYERARGGEVSVRAKEDGAITEVPKDAFRVEYFGQGELSEIARDPLNSPRLFQDFLDRHTYLSDLLTREESIVIELRENAAQLIPLEAGAGQLIAKREALAGIEQKLKIAEEGHLREIVSTKSKVTSEKTMRGTLETIAQSYKLGLSLAKFECSFDQLRASAGDFTGDAESDKLFDEIRNTLEEANAFLRQKAEEVNKRLATIGSELEAKVTALKANHGRMEFELATKIAGLKAKGLAGNLAELTELLQQKGNLGTEIAAIELRQPDLLGCRGKRRDLLNQLSLIRNEMTARRKAQLADINRNLTTMIADYVVAIKYEESGVADEFFDLLQLKMTGSYFPDPSAKLMCEKITPKALAGLIIEKDREKLAAAAGVATEWADQIILRLGTWATICDLEILAKPPKPVIIVKTRAVPSKEIPVIQLSDGQRHTILLTVALLSDANIPLIIDQPEDDLDNAFIFSSIVATLRAVKEKRQVILVTHNANIAVLGDSELILPMHRDSESGKSVDRGSIDTNLTKLHVQKILEGGPEAFARRKEIYGH